jgi:RNA polymerase sigma-70 factor (ECF subfamily)
MTNWADAYKQYAPEIKAFLERRMWGRMDEAEDLCQETFARVVSAAVELRDPSKVKSYLMRTANNLLISRLRRGGLVRSESDLGEDADLAGRPDPRAVDPHAEAQKLELQTKVEDLLVQLPKDQRIAFEQGVLQRRPYAQIAHEYNWSENKVKICVYRARKRLMEGLREYR